MVESIADDKAALADKQGDDGRVGGKAHAKSDGRLLAQEACHATLKLDMLGRCPCRDAAFIAGLNSKCQEGG